MNLNKISCPKCNAENSAFSSKIKTYICRSCGSQVDLKQNTLTGYKPRFFGTKTDLKLGDVGNINNLHVEVIGAIKYKSRDDEGTYYWEEWFLVSDQGYHWLQYDYYDRTYTFFSQIIPTKPIDIKKRSGLIELTDEHSFRIRERGLATITAMIGQLPWLAKAGDKISFIDGRQYRNRYSIEWSAQELECYFGFELTKLQVLKAFDKKEKIISYHNISKRMKLMTRWGSALVVLLFIGMLVSFGSGKTLVNESHTVCAQKSIECVDKEALIGPFSLKNDGRVYKINLSTSTAKTNNWPYGYVELLDENKESLRAFGGDFWRDQGESNVSKSTIIKPKKSGEYYISLTSYKETVGKSSTSSDSYTIAVTEDMMVTRYYLLGMIGVIAIWGFHNRSLGYLL